MLTICRCSCFQCTLIQCYWLLPITIIILFWISRFAVIAVVLVVVVIAVAGVIVGVVVAVVVSVVLIVGRGIQIICDTLGSRQFHQITQGRGKGLFVLGKFKMSRHGGGRVGLK